MLRPVPRLCVSLPVVAWVWTSASSADAHPFAVQIQDTEVVEPAPGTAPVVAAEPLSDDPALEYRRGEQAYALGNYGDAVRHFERSYQLSNYAELLYNLGLSYLQWHGLDGDEAHLRKAQRLFQNYTKRLSEDPSMDQSQREEVEGHLVRIDELLASSAATPEPPPPVVVVTPDPAPVEPPTATPTDEPTKRPLHRRGWFWGLLGGIVLVGAVTTAVLLTRKPGFEPELGTIGPNASAVGLRF